MNSNIKLSYVITTFNKLPFLKLTLGQLFENIQPNEEIVITDAASTDGTPEYLKDLYHKGLIHQYVSEPDKSEAHGFNKGFLMAKGELIKILTDDDVFYYKGIRACKKFMLDHPEIDLLGGNTSSISLGTDDFNTKIDNETFKSWRKKEIDRFWFNGQPIIFRKQQIPLLGLFNTSILPVDYEFTMRITASRNVKIAWCPYILATGIKSINSNSINQIHKLTLHVKQVDAFYELKNVFYKNQIKQHFHWGFIIYIKQYYIVLRI